MWFRDDFRRGIVQGDKPVIYPVLEWLLRHMSELKERAYLARYLVKVDIPQDFMVDSQISELYEQVHASVCLCENFEHVLQCGLAHDRLNVRHSSERHRDVVHKVI